MFALKPTLLNLTDEDKCGQHCDINAQQKTAFFPDKTVQSSGIWRIFGITMEGQPRRRGG